MRTDASIENVAPLALGVVGVEDERGLPQARHAGDDHCSPFGIEARDA
jgi:hypothetical protein